MFRSDFTILDRHGEAVAQVEVKNLRGKSPAWAAEFRRNLLEHGQSFAPFFLIVTSDRLYLWTHAAERAASALPDAEVDLAPLLAPYFERLRPQPGTISGQAFELLIESWLSDLTRLHETSARSPELTESGFLASIRDGRISDPVAA